MRNAVYLKRELMRTLPEQKKDSWIETWTSRKAVYTRYMLLELCLSKVFILEFVIVRRNKHICTSVTEVT